MNLTDSQKAGAAAAFLLVAGLVAHLLLPVGTDAAAGHVVVPFDGGQPSGAVLVKATARADAAAMARFHVDAGGAPFGYFRVYLCAAPIDGGTDPGPHLAQGMDVVYDDDQVGPCPDGGPQLEAWLQGRTDAPFLCACSTGSSCLQGDGGAALQGVTLQPGQWSGAGCLPKVCVEMAGSSSWPQECPQ